MKKEIENHLVSIITPAYNSEKYIEECIKSVLLQTYKNWELLIVDDCSNDKTQEIVNKNNDNRIKYIKLSKNSGAAVARNIALEKAKGRYIAFLDADDVWKANKLEQQLEYMSNYNYSFTFTAYEMLKVKKKKIIEVPQSLNYKQFMRNTIIGTSTVMIDRYFINDIRLVNIRKDHDSMTWAKILKKGIKAHGLNVSLTYYRKVEGSISNNKIKAVKRHWKNCREIEQLPFFKCLYYFVFYSANAVKKHFF